MTVMMISPADKNMIQFPDRSRCSNFQHIRQYWILAKSSLVVSEKSISNNDMQPREIINFIENAES